MRLAQRENEEQSKPGPSQGQAEVQLTRMKWNNKPFHFTNGNTTSTHGTHARALAHTHRAWAGEYTRPRVCLFALTCLNYLREVNCCRGR